MVAMDQEFYPKLQPTQPLWILQASLLVEVIGENHVFVMCPLFSARILLVWDGVVNNTVKQVVFVCHRFFVPSDL
jgi:hypothetical protein